jgi:hypothetical protein
MRRGGLVILDWILSPVGAKPQILSLVSVCQQKNQIAIAALPGKIQLRWVIGGGTPCSLPADYAFLLRFCAIVNFLYVSSVVHDPILHSLG